MSEDAIQQLISGSPALETLELSQFSSGIKRVQITNHARVRKLVLGELGIHGIRKIKLLWRSLPCVYITESILLILCVESHGMGFKDADISRVS